ncbi:MAG: YebC/PmpR family DNA-binding transcriptional regulator [Candidatus Portnoybacteria bacterium]|nr:YebC/PmpR family DNA-binding transcriptional regulator [Candidatus Portnoybacteria bacterium]
MSGHSKWSQIKHKKALTDAKKSKVFSKLARLISVAARQKGGDQNTNPQLRIIAEKARSLNMPNENIERAIKRGTGEIEGGKIEEITLEAYGPEGIALIIEAVTDNKNRTISEIKFLLSQHGGKMAEIGSVNWLFEKKGVIYVDSTNESNNQKGKEELELTAIEAGAQDLKWSDETMLEIYTRLEDFEKTKEEIGLKNIKIESSAPESVPKSEIKVENEKSKEQIKKLLEALDENDDVNEIYSNYREQI